MWLVTDVSGQPIGPIFQRKSSPTRRNPRIILLKTANHKYTLHNIPEDRRSHLHCGGSLKSRIIYLLILSNMAMVREFDAMSGKLNVVCMCE